MNKWIAEFDLEDGDTMPEHMDLEYKGVKLDFHCRPIEQEPQTFKWCETCKEYDQEKHCCHRWSKVIRDTVEEMKQEQEPMVEIDLYSVIKQKYIEREVLDKIRAEIIKYESDCRLSVDEYPLCEQCTDNVFETIYGILDKYKAKSEVEK